MSRRWSPDEVAVLKGLRALGIPYVTIGQLLKRSPEAAEVKAWSMGFVKTRVKRQPVTPPVEVAAVEVAPVEAVEPAKPLRIVAAPAPKRTFDELLAAVRAGEAKVGPRPMQPHVPDTRTYGGISSVYDG